MLMFPYLLLQLESVAAEDLPYLNFPPIRSIAFMFNQAVYIDISLFLCFSLFPFITLSCEQRGLRADFEMCQLCRAQIRKRFP